MPCVVFVAVSEYVSSVIYF